MNHTGTLYVIATPIGNLDDLSPRAIKTLNSVDLVLAEDTRVFGKLKARFQIETPAKSYHNHNERDAAAGLVEELDGGKNMALTSDAGTPTISDPGYRIVRACREHGIPVITIPGPCAAAAALSISGLPSDRFTFEGFLPQKSGKRKTALLKAVESQATTIFYESPFRIAKALGELASIAPECEVFLGRELTKLHEESIFGSAKEVAKDFVARPSVKGELVLILKASGDGRRATENRLTTS